MQKDSIKKFYLFWILALQFGEKLRRIIDILVFAITIKDKLLLWVILSIEEYKNEKVKSNL